MGCDLCVFVPAQEDHDSAMSYSTFDGLRAYIASLYLQEHKEDIEPNMVGIFNYSHLQDLLKKYMNEYESGISFARVLYEWLNHSDCDGEYWYDECKDIAIVLEHYLPKFSEDVYYKGFVESLIETFKYAAENKGIVVVC